MLIDGELEGFFETGTEGVCWCVYDTRQELPGGMRTHAGLHELREGDELVIFSADGSERWRGIIKPNHTIGWRPYPLNPEYGQQVANGMWVHWIQDGFAPDDWGALFWHKPALRARLVRGEWR